MSEAIRKHETDEADVRPWEQSGSVRRDCDPHRAAMLHLLSVVGFWLCILLPCTAGISGVIGLALAVSVWRMARADMGRIERGLMDPDGWQGTKDALYLAVGAMAFAGLFVFIIGTVVCGRLYVTGYFKR